MSDRTEHITDSEQLAAAEAALAELRAERREVEYYEQLATKMQTSVSWRITAPLRAVKVLAAKIRKKLEERDS